MTRYALLTLAMMASLLVAFGVAVALEVPLLMDPTPWMSESGPGAAAVGAGLLVADVLLPVPSSLVMTAHGALFGIAGGAALSTAGGVGAAALGFAIGRRGGGLIERLVSAEERVRADALLERWGALALVLSRPVPIVAETVAILAGASPLGWRRALAAAAAGSAPAALLYAITGATVASFDAAALTFALVLGVTGIFWAAGRWAGR